MQLKFVIFGWIILVFYASLFVSATDFVVYTVATDATDGYKRMTASAKLYNISVQTLGMGEQWQGGNVALFAGGGQKINILREEMARYKDDRDTVVLFVDGYDVVFTAGAEELLKTFNRFEARVLFSAEDACWPDRSLEDLYPLVKANEKRFLNSGGFMGYAHEVYEMLRVADVKHNDDDQLYFTHVYLNESLRTDLKIKLDKRADIFLNLNGALDDVQLKFKGAQSYLYNSKTGNTPLILHGNGPIKVQFNRLADYVPNKWTPSVGCVECSTGTLSLSTLQPDDFPLVFMAVFLHHPIPFIEDFFQRLAALNYPKHRINVFLHYGVDFHENEVKTFAKNHASDYHRLTVLGPAEGVAGAAAKNKALEECMLAQCQYLFVVDGEVQLDNRQTLQLLIERNRSVIAPLVYRPGKLWSNFWGLLTDNGFYRRSEDYIAIVQGERRGQWNVPYISSVYLIHGYHIPHLQGFYGDGTIDVDIAFAQNLRNKGIFMYVDNLEVSYGHLVNNEDFDTSHLHNDLYTIFSNPHTWALKYIHENYSHALDPNTVNLQPCPDVFQFPIVSEAFCRDLVDEVEFLGQWSNGKNEDSRLATGYENVPTVDIHTNQIGWEPHWLHFLKTYILPLNLKVFPGYYSEGKSIMNFVVRYKPTEQSFLRPHHDSSTFSINIALNQPFIDFEGGGTKFIRYNCSVLDSPRGWMLMHPGRLTHYHEGLKVTAGTRYIMVAFVDP